MKIFLPGEHVYQAHLWMLFNGNGKEGYKPNGTNDSQESLEPQPWDPNKRNRERGGRVCKVGLWKHVQGRVSLFLPVRVGGGMPAEQSLSSCTDSSNHHTQHTPRKTPECPMPCFYLQALFPIVCSTTRLALISGNVSHHSLIYLIIWHALLHSSSNHLSCHN